MLRRKKNRFGPIYAQSVGASDPSDQAK